MRKGFFTVMSSHGELVACSDNGQVIRRERYDASDPESAFIDAIFRFDVVEWACAYPTQNIDRGCVDILDIGYHYRFKDGNLYEPPVAEYRRERKETQSCR